MVLDNFRVDKILFNEFQSGLAYDMRRFCCVMGWYCMIFEWFGVLWGGLGVSMDWFWGRDDPEPLSYDVIPSKMAETELNVDSLISRLLEGCY